MAPSNAPSSHPVEPRTRPATGADGSPVAGIGDAAAFGAPGAPEPTGTPNAASAAAGAAAAALAAGRAPTLQASRWRVSVPWLVALALFVCVIWGNSMVPGDDSGAMSLSVLASIQAFLDSVGIPSGWITNFLVRKAAHFSEYLVMACIAMQALHPHRVGRGRAAVPALVTACTLVAVPCIDETIQLFVSGRAGQMTDVLIDCSGALTGVLLTLVASTLLRRRKTRRAAQESGA